MNMPSIRRRHQDEKRGTQLAAEFFNRLLTPEQAFGGDLLVARRGRIRPAMRPPLALASRGSVGFGRHRVVTSLRPGVSAAVNRDLRIPASLGGVSTEAGAASRPPFGAGLVATGSSSTGGR